MRDNVFQTLFGFVVIGISFLFCTQVYKFSSSDSLKKPYTTLRAKFSNIEGVSVGTAVKIGGVKIGKVSSLDLDDDLKVIMTIIIGDGVRLGEDSAISIMSSGILGSKYVDIAPGFENEYLQDGEFFRSTKSVLNIETLVGKFAMKK